MNLYHKIPYDIKGSIRASAGGQVFVNTAAVKGLGLHNKT